jgi:hypothetical protein
VEGEVDVALRGFTARVREALREFDALVRAFPVRGRVDG